MSASIIPRCTNSPAPMPWAVLCVEMTVIMTVFIQCYDRFLDVHDFQQCFKMYKVTCFKVMSWLVCGDDCDHDFDHSVLWSCFLDVDECQQRPKVCEFTCSNTLGSFVCGCPAGYVLNMDQRTCRGQLVHSISSISQISDACWQQRQ